MTNRKRVIASIEHRQPDRTPYQIGFTQPAYARYAAYTGDERIAEKLDNCLLTLDTTSAGGWTEVRPHIWRDEWGVEWDRSVDPDIGVVCNRLVTPENVATFPCPDAADPSRYAGYEAALASRPDLYPVANLGFSLYERAWTLAGMEDLMAGMVLDKPFVHRLLDRILEFNLGVIERACSHPIEAMMFGDDWGQQSGLQMGLALWREFIKPRVAQMYGAVKACGKRVFIHSCGKVDELFPDLIECGLDVFNPFRPEVINVEVAKREYGRDLTFFGGISTQRTLPYGSLQQVRDEVRRLIEVVGKDGGLIAAPAHAIPGDARPENIEAMIEVLHEG
jgi:uroporphyrinogen decarboxylase